MNKLIQKPEQEKKEVINILDEKIKELYRAAMFTSGHSNSCSVNAMSFLEKHIKNEDKKRALKMCNILYSAGYFRALEDFSKLIRKLLTAL